MGLRDDLPDEALEAAEQNNAEQLAQALLEAVQEGDVDEAVECVSDVMGALYELDEDAFDGSPGFAQPEFHAYNDWSSIGVDANWYEGAAEIEMVTAADGLSFWCSVPEIENSSVSFKLSPASAMWLSRELSRFVARAQSGDYWEKVKHPEVDDGT